MEHPTQACAPNVDAVQPLYRDDEVKLDTLVIGARFSSAQSNLFRCEIEGVRGIFEVHTQLGECTCRILQMMSLPCIHAIAFIATRPSPVWRDYVDIQYSVERYKTAYSGAISTMPGKDQWEFIEADAVLAPDTARPCGRPRSKRFKNFLETERGSTAKNTHKCGRCAQ